MAKRKAAPKATAPAKAAAKPVEASPADKQQATATSRDNLQQLQDMVVEVSVVLGRTKCTLDQILDLDEQSMVRLERMHGEMVDVRVNGKLFARGEVVTVSENFGVRLIEIIDHPKA